MKKVYTLFLICCTISCKQEAQTPEKFINTINETILNINGAMEKNMSNNIGLSNDKMLETLDSISIEIKESIKNVSSLKEINDSLKLKKEVLIFLKKTDTLISIDYTEFLERTIAVQKSNSLSDLSKKLSIIEPSSIDLFEKAINLMEDGAKINEKLLVYHKIYDVPLPNYLKEANQE